MKMMNFRKLSLINPLIRASTEAGFGSPTALQSKIIPKIILKKNVIGCIQNKTERIASFVIPVIQTLKKNTVEYRNIRVLIITSTASSALEINDAFQLYSKYLPISKFSILDDEPQGSQIYQLRKGRDILIATPERLLDLMQQGHADFSKLEMLIVDNVDKLADLNLLDVSSKIMERLPVKKQNILLSESPSKQMKHFVSGICFNPTEINIPTEFSVKEKVSHPLTQENATVNLKLQSASISKDLSSFAF